MVTTHPPKTIVEPRALGTVANTDTKMLIYSLFQKGRVLAQDGVTVEGDLPFSPALTQWEELELLVARTVHAAAAIRRTLVEHTEGGAPWND